MSVVTMPCELIGNGNGLWSILASTQCISEDDESGRTVVEVHQVIRDMGGKILMDRMVQHVYSIHDDLITRMDIREPDTDAISRSSE